MNESREKGFANGDAVIGYDGDLVIRGVVHEVYDDVVEIEYLDEFGQIDSMEFHEDFVESVI